MNKLTVRGSQEFLGISIPVVEGGFGEGKRCILAKDIATIHEAKLKRVNENIRKNIDGFEIGIDLIDLKTIGYGNFYTQELFELEFTKEDIRKSNNIYLLSESGYKKLCTKMRNKNISLCNDVISYYFLGSKINDYMIVDKEVKFLNKLEESLKPFRIEGTRQHKVLSYRVDFYIANLKMAIEYDENDHKCYTYERHEGRQKDIESELGCKFIRVSDKNSDEYNIGVVLKEIFTRLNYTYTS